MIKHLRVANAIPENEIILAAMFFAISNMALDDVFKDKMNMRGGKIDLKLAERGANMLLAEIDEDLDEERDDWYIRIRKGDSYCNKEWMENRERFVLPE
jgi:hypothetical protein